MQVDLGTTYLGLRLRSPVIASASPLSGSLEGVRRLAAAGVGAVVLPSVFQEQLDDEVTIEVLPDWGLREAHAGHELAVDLDTYNRGPEALLTLTRRARRAVDIATGRVGNDEFHGALGP